MAAQPHFSRPVARVTLRADERGLPMVRMVMKRFSRARRRAAGILQQPTDDC
jgi:hypothetical protein